ncbi:hypothetical protein [Xylanibacter ruminicola]|uniref:hypothetical protein n=1 Tax=Xylanibacter ruminicola TaxID=839 RepID=UPI0011B00480|nr:hypothetical protein [Xylanibacter ruminicola]
MSLPDFDQCTPLEFEMIFEMWHESQEVAFRTSWEQTRQLAVCVLQPYASKTLKPRDVMEFSWDQPDSKGQTHKKKTNAEREAEKKHFEEVKKARGLS